MIDPTYDPNINKKGAAILYTLAAGSVIGGGALLNSKHSLTKLIIGITLVGIGVLLAFGGVWLWNTPPGRPRVMQPLLHPPHHRAPISPSETAQAIKDIRDHIVGS